MLIALCMESGKSASPIRGCQSYIHLMKINIFHLSGSQVPSSVESQPLYYLSYFFYYFLTLRAQSHTILHSSFSRSKHLNSSNRNARQIFHVSMTFLRLYPYTYKIFFLMLAFILFYGDNQISSLLKEIMLPLCTNYHKYTFPCIVQCKDGEAC